MPSLILLLPKRTGRQKRRPQEEKNSHKEAQAAQEGTRGKEKPTRFFAPSLLAFCAFCASLWLFLRFLGTSRFCGHPGSCGLSPSRSSQTRFLARSRRSA